MGLDEFAGKGIGALNNILKKTDPFLEKPLVRGKDLEKYFWGAFRGKKNLRLLSSPLNLVIDASYIRYGALEHAFAGPPEEDA